MNPYYNKLQIEQFYYHDEEIYDRYHLYEYQVMNLKNKNEF